MYQLSASAALIDEFEKQEVILHPMITYYSTKYCALKLSLGPASDGVDRLCQSLFDANFDINPRQIKVALFVLKNPLGKGVIMESFH